MSLRSWSQCLTFIAAFSWLLACSTASLRAQSLAAPGAASDESTAWQYDLFQLLLEEHKLKVERSMQSIVNSASKSVIVVGNDGNNDVRSISPYEMIVYVENGGAILLMHELNGFGRQNAIAMSGIGTLHRGPVSALHASDTYEGYSDCVRVSNISDREGLFSGIGTLITNRAGWFRPSDSSDWDWEVVATFPVATVPVDGQPKHLMAVGRPRNGRGGMAIVLSDSSLLTNNMLWHGDNSRLALRLAELFKQQGRDRFHMLRNNISLDSITEKIAEKLRQERERSQPNLPVPKPTFAQMLDLGNIVAKEVIDSNVLNEALQRQPRHMSARRYFTILIILLIAAVIAVVLVKMLTTGPLRELWLSRRRQRFSYEIQAGNASGDYRTAASYLAQEFCVQWTGSHHSRQWQQALATLLARMPSVTPSDRHELTRIVDIASRGCHERMMGSDFQNFGKKLDELRRYFISTATA